MSIKLLKLKELTREQGNRYSRHILLPAMDWTGQEKLLASHVVVLGLGGLGCAAAQFLAMSGVGKLTLIDDDVVELSNLQRQVLHSEAKIGMNKALSAKEHITLLNSDVVINVVTKRLAKPELTDLAQQTELFVDCTDNLSSRNLLNEVSVATNTPLITGAAIRLEGQVCCFFPNSTSLNVTKTTAQATQTPTHSEPVVSVPCYACFSQLFGKPQHSCMESGVLSPVVGIVGAMQALEVVKYLSGVGVVPNAKLMLFDAATSEWRTMKIVVNPNCPVCQTHSE